MRRAFEKIVCVLTSFVIMVATFIVPISASADSTYDYYLPYFKIYMKEKGYDYVGNYNMGIASLSEFGEYGLWNNIGAYNSYASFLKYLDDYESICVLQVSSSFVNSNVGGDYAKRIEYFGIPSSIQSLTNSSSNVSLYSGIKIPKFFVIYAFFNDGRSPLLYTSGCTVSSSLSFKDLSTVSDEFYDFSIKPLTNMDLSVYNKLNQDEILDTDKVLDALSLNLLGQLNSSNYRGSSNSLDETKKVGTDFTKWLYPLLTGQDISSDVSTAYSDDDYVNLVNDLKNNTTTSSYWNNVDESKKTNIKNTYSNLVKSYGDNVYSWTDKSTGNTYYSPVYNSDTTVPTYYNTTNYFNDYILDDGVDVTTNVNIGTGGGGVGDIIISIDNSNGGINNENNNNINIGGDVTTVPGVSSSEDTSTTTSSDTEIDISAFQKLINSCKNFINCVTAFFNNWDNDVKVAFCSLIVVVVVCRVLGR